MNKQYGFTSVKEYQEAIVEKRLAKGKVATKHDLEVVADSLCSWYQKERERLQLPPHEYYINSCGVCVCPQCSVAIDYMISGLKITYIGPASQEDLRAATKAWNRK